jgi:hypothetical protein
LVANEITPEQIFSTDATDTDLAAVTALGQATIAEPADHEGGEQL